VGCWGQVSHCTPTEPPPLELDADIGDEILEGFLKSVDTLDDGCHCGS